MTINNVILPTSARWRKITYNDIEEQYGELPPDPDDSDVPRIVDKIKHIKGLLEAPLPTIPRLSSDEYAVYDRAIDYLFRQLGLRQYEGDERTLPTFWNYTPVGVICTAYELRSTLIMGSVESNKSPGADQWVTQRQASMIIGVARKTFAVYMQKNGHDTSVVLNYPEVRLHWAALDRDHPRTLRVVN